MKINFFTCNQILFIIPSLSEYLFPLHHQQFTRNMHQLKLPWTSPESEKPALTLILHICRIFLSTELFTKLIHFMLQQYTKVHLQCICFFTSTNQKMMKVSLYLVQSGDLGHGKDCGKAKNLPPWTVQNAKEVSLYTTYMAQEHLYHFIAKIHLARCCFSSKNPCLWREYRKRI